MMSDSSGSVFINLSVDEPSSEANESSSTSSSSTGVAAEEFQPLGNEVKAELASKETVGMQFIIHGLPEANVKK